ncbi:GNAT family N-acyltransferase [Psychromonas sp. PT13]|uniref:GNAT family N-acyltransferase n=1 Tax=Psychromonas sp. PT13 TaxID=3439547 RepID=UPI003EBCFCBD
MISVETVLSNNIPILEERPYIRKRLLPLLRQLLHEREFKHFEQNYPHLQGFDFLEQALEYFDFSYSVRSRDRIRIPAKGRVVIVANHPIGSLDGLALLKMVGEIRRDVKVVANAVLMAVKPLNALLLPVDNMNNRTSRHSIKAIEAHLENDAALVIFPAGEVSRISPMGVRDTHWRNSFLRFATKTKAPIVPIFVDARNSWFFYSLSLVAKPLSTLWLVREMFKQTRCDIPIRIGKAIPFDCYDSLPLDLNGKAKLFRKHVYKLAKNRGIPALESSFENIAYSEPRQLLREEIRACELLGSTSDDMSIYLYNNNGDSVVMREIARLREVSFRAVGEGSGKRRDRDRYDSYYDHIVLWDDKKLAIVGAYRLVKTKQIIEEKGIEALYTNTLFEYQLSAKPYLEKGVELGRSFVQPEYWGTRSLNYLWYGIGAYLKRFPEVHYLIGPVSLSNAYPSAAKHALVNFYKTHFNSPATWVKARQPYHCNEQKLIDKEQSYQEAFAELKAKMKSLGVSVPTLYKQYSEICEPGGVQFVDFNIDADFADCIDGFVAVDINQLKPSKRKRYFNHQK